MELLIAALLGFLVWTGRLKRPEGPQRFLLYGMGVVILIGLLQLSRQGTVFDARTPWPFTMSVWATRKALLLWLSYCGLIAAAGSILDRPARLERLAWAIFLLGAITGVAGLGFQSFDSSLALGFRRITHPYTAAFGPFIDRDHAATFLGMSGGVGLGLFWGRLTRLRRARQPLADGIAKAAMVFSLLAALVFCLRATGSRGGAHAFFLSCALVSMAGSFIFARGRLKAALLFGILAAAAAYAWMLYAFPFWRGYSQGVLAASFRARISLYRSGLRMARDFWPFGVGLGAFRFAFPAYQGSFIKGLVLHVHDDWLELVLETGVCGFAAFAAGVAAMLGSGISAWKNCESSESRAMIGGALAGMLVLLLHMLVDFPFQMPGDAVTFFLISCLLRPRRPGREEGGLAASVSWRAKAGAVALCACMAALTLPAVVADYDYLQARSAPPNAIISYLEPALRLEPNPDYALLLGWAYDMKAYENAGQRRVLLEKAMGTVAPYCRLYPADSALESLQIDIARRLSAARA
ncbi:MAG: O-antigen ligase family protein [Elusimicrobia bacterium]|nr:O-antigen ligase family protein [Elusimicrobiota bacterium]